MNNPIKQILSRYSTAQEAVEANPEAILLELCTFAGISCEDNSCGGEPALVITTYDFEHYGSAWTAIQNLPFLNELTTAIAEKIGAEWVNAGTYAVLFQSHLNKSTVDAKIEWAIDLGKSRGGYSVVDSQFFAILNAGAKERLAALALAVAAKLESEGE